MISIYLTQHIYIKYSEYGGAEFNCCYKYNQVTGRAVTIGHPKSKAVVLGPLTRSLLDFELTFNVIDCGSVIKYSSISGGANDLNCMWWDSGWHRIY